MTIQHPRTPAIAGALIAAFSAATATAADSSLAPVVVTATRQQMRASEILSDVTIIDREAIAAAGPSSTVAELLSRQPGVEMSRNGPAGTQTDIRIRGANSNQTILMIDGVRVGSATNGAATWSRIPLSEIDRIEILRGPASSLYGNDAIGGVVQIFTRRGEDGGARLFVEAGAGSQETSQGTVGIAGGGNGWRYSLNTSTFRTEGFSSVTNKASSSYNPDPDGYKNLTSSASLSYTPSKGSEVGIHYFNSTGRNRYDSTGSGGTKNSDYQSQSDVTSYGAFAKAALSDFWTTTVRFGRSDDDQTTYVDNKSYSPTKSSTVFRTTQNQATWQNDFRLPVGNALLAVERLDQTVSGGGGFTLNQRTIDSYLAGWNGQFGIQRLQANLRRDENSQFGNKNTGNIGYGLLLSDHWRTHASYGTAYKAPTFNDLYFPPTPLISGTMYGNPNLKPESSKNAEIALHFEQGLHQASVTYYRNRVVDMISWSGRLTPDNIGKATLEGVTLAYTGQVLGLDVGSSIDWQDARDDATGMRLGRRARERGMLTLGKRSGAWELRGEMTAIGKRYDADYSTSTPNRNILGGYTLFNLYGSYALARDWSAFVRADNIFDKKYEQALNYAPPGASIFFGLRFTPSL